MIQFRNILVACGAFYLSIWVSLPLTMLWSLIANHLRFSGGLQLMLLMPAVFAVPEVLVAIATGVVTVLMVNSRSPARWALLPAGLFLDRHIFSRRFWAIAPTTADYVAIAVEAALPAIACILTAAVFDGRRSIRDPQL